MSKDFPNLFTMIFLYQRQLRAELFPLCKRTLVNKNIINSNQLYIGFICYNSTYFSIKGKKNGAPPSPNLVNLKSNTMKNTLQRYAVSANSTNFWRNN